MLYICATPIGNLDDISLRAIKILSLADRILCEDTRVSRHLLNAHNINHKQVTTLNEHNENEVADQIMGQLAAGLVIVLISDAGTPGISDPGARLCNKVRAAGFAISPIPGACAYISLLSVSGLLNTPSLFHGFLPHQSTARCKILSTWEHVDYAVCIYEAPHRIIACMQDIIATLGSERSIIMGRELTKHFETIKKCTCGELLEFIQADPNQQRGEFALIIEPKMKTEDSSEALTTEQINLLKLLLPELPPKKAVALTHKIAGGHKDLLYNYTLTAKTENK